MSSVRAIRLDHLIGVYAVGSGGWSWRDEHDKLIDRPVTQELIGSIRTDGIREPVLLGSDGRVWDGHHRIIIAMHLGLDTVPVEFSGAVAEEPEVHWQWSYVEKWTDGSGVYDRQKYDNELSAFRCLADSAESMVALNREFDAADQIVASVEKRRTYEPGDWVTVNQEGKIE